MGTVHPPFLHASQKLPILKFWEKCLYFKQMLCTTIKRRDIYTLCNCPGDIGYTYADVSDRGFKSRFWQTPQEQPGHLSKIFPVAVPAIPVAVAFRPRSRLFHLWCVQSSRHYRRTNSLLHMIAGLEWIRYQSFENPLPPLSSDGVDVLLEPEVENDFIAFDDDELAVQDDELAAAHAGTLTFNVPRSMMPMP